MNAIEVKQLSKDYGSLDVIRDLDLGVPEGTIYGLLGRNGCGKTTLLKTLIGLLLPDSGTQQVLGTNLAEGAPTQKVEVGYIAQGEILPAWAKIGDLIAFERDLHPKWNDESLKTWMKGERLNEKRRVRHLSVGQRKRLELELVLASSPRVLLMDEPFAGLNPVARADVLEKLLGFVADQQLTVLLSSHILSDLERLCDRIGIMAHGKIALEASMDDLKSGAAVVSAKADQPEAKPAPADSVVAEFRTNSASTWLMVNVNGSQVNGLTEAGYKVTQGTLDDLGTEPIRSIEPR